MKKILKAVGIVLLVILALLIALPFLFKDKIAEQVRAAANESLNATMDFSDVSISLISNFPKASIELNGLTIDGVEEFKGVRLIEMESIATTVDIMSLFGETIKIESIDLSNGKVDVRVLRNGSANYDIVKSEDVETSGNDETDEESGDFALNLNHYALNNIDVYYDDQSAPMTADIKGLTHVGNGDFTADKTLMETNTSMQSIDLEYDRVTFLKKALVSMIINLDLDLANNTFKFVENQIDINDFSMAVDGTIDMPDENIGLDITYSTTESDFKSLLSLVPAEFATDLQGVEADGTMAFNGFIKGDFGPKSLPGFGLNVNVNDGRFNYPDLPKSVENIQLDLQIDASDGNDLDAAIVDIQRFYMEMANNPVDLRLKLSTPMTDPNIDCDLQAKVILDNLQDVIPLEEGETISGSINADLALHGKMSTIESEDYENFDARGQIILQKLAFRSDQFMYPMDVDVAYLNFSPQKLELSQFDARIGESDIQAQGQMDNYLAFALRDELLRGDFNMTSSLLDLNELMGDEDSDEATEVDADTTSTYEVLEIPGNIDFRLNSRLDKVIYDDVEIENAVGMIEIKDHVAILRDVKMDVLGGQVIMDGSYSTEDPSQPEIAMDYDIRKLEIKETAEKFNTIDRLVSIASSCTGKFSTDMQISAMLDAQMEPIEQTISGNGSLQTHKVTIESFQPLTDLASQLGIQALSSPTLSDMNLSYVIENGKAIVSPFVVKVDDMEAEVQGSTSLISEQIDYTAKMGVPFEKLPGNLAGQASGLLEQLNGQLGTSLSTGDEIPVNIRVTGTIDDPKLSTSYGDVEKGAGQTVQEQVVEEVKEVVQEAIDDTKEKAVEEAQKQADQLVKEAEQQADQLIEETKKQAQKVKDAAYAEADKLENKGANFIEKAANKTAATAMRKEADKAYDKAVAEAQKQADQLIKEAEQEANEIINSVD